MTNTKGTFDFTQINEATNGLPAGMKIAIAEGLLINVCKTLNKFEHELEEKANEVLEELQVFKAEYKVSSLKARLAKATNEETGAVAE